MDNPSEAEEIEVLRLCVALAEMTRISNPDLVPIERLISLRQKLAQREQAAL